MNTYKSSELTRLPMRLWRRFQHWRAMRIYRRVDRMHFEAQVLTYRADRLIAKHVKPPMPLFDRLDSRG
jgi:hypothetical protein